jgi:hypothetical protein
VADDEIIHVAVAPPAGADASLVKNVAAIINRGPYDTRLLLAGEIPKIVAHCGSQQQAESIVQNLRGLGLAAIACKDSELRRFPQPFEAQTLGFGEKEVLFRDSAGGEKRVVAKNVFLILVGKMETSVELETTKTKTKFNLSMTLLTGIPVWRKVEEKSTTRSTNTEYFARLYEPKSPDPGVEMVQHNLNYAFLGAELAASSFTNFGTVVRRLRVVFPKAIFDDRLAKPAALAASSSREGIEINCRLIYLFHKFHKVAGGQTDNH